MTEEEKLLLDVIASDSQTITTTLKKLLHCGKTMICEWFFFLLPLSILLDSVEVSLSCDFFRLMEEESLFIRTLQSTFCNTSIYKYNSTYML